MKFDSIKQMVTPRELTNNQSTSATVLPSKGIRRRPSWQLDCLTNPILTIKTTIPCFRIRFNQPDWSTSAAVLSTTDAQEGSTVDNLTDRPTPYSFQLSLFLPNRPRMRFNLPTCNTSAPAESTTDTMSIVDDLTSTKPKILTGNHPPLDSNRR